MKRRPRLTRSYGLGRSHDVALILDDGDIADVSGVGATQSRLVPPSDRGPPLRLRFPVGPQCIEHAPARVAVRMCVLRARAGSGSSGSAARSSSSAEAAVEQGLVPGGEGRRIVGRRPAGFRRRRIPAGPHRPGQQGPSPAATSLAADRGCASHRLLLSPPVPGK